MEEIKEKALDASAVIAFLRKEQGELEMTEMLRNPAITCYMHVLNLCEVYYDARREHSKEDAQNVIADLRAVGIQMRDDLDDDFWQQVGELKVRGKISLADCFCIALALRIGGDVVTSDHKEFDVIAQQGICSVHFIR